MWYRAFLFALITAPMAFFIAYMWVTYPDQVLLNSIGTAVMTAADLFLLAILITADD